MSMFPCVPKVVQVSNQVYGIWCEMVMLRFVPHQQPTGKIKKFGDLS